MTELVVRGMPGAPSQHEMMVFQTMAEQAVNSKMYKGVGDTSAVMMIMLAARELGIPPVQALNGGINIINGKVEISARMMSALIRKSGHHIGIKENSDNSCTLVGKRLDSGETATVSYTFAEAQKAGLVKTGGGWMKNPKDMCFARALSRLARQLFSDVIGIGYVEGEIKAMEAVPIIPDDVTTEENYEDPAEVLNEYLSLFDQDDKHYALEYLSVVGKHFEWPQSKTIYELKKDTTKLMDKFNVWKDRQIKSITMVQDAV
jgi:hypothetical protein